MRFRALQFQSLYFFCMLTFLYEIREPYECAAFWASVFEQVNFDPACGLYPVGISRCPLSHNRLGCICGRCTPPLRCCHILSFCCPKAKAMGLFSAVPW